MWDIVLSEKAWKHTQHAFMVGIKNVSVCFPSDLFDGLAKKFVCVELINRVKVVTNHNGNAIT